MLTSRKPIFSKGNESLQKLLIELIREHLNSKKYKEALGFIRLLSVTPDMTEIPLKELFFALLSLSGASASKKVELPLPYFSLLLPDNF